jgi:hypothetical protein
MNTLVRTSEEACRVLADAPTTPTALALPMTPVGIELSNLNAVVHEQ